MSLTLTLYIISILFLIIALVAVIYTVYQLLSIYLKEDWQLFRIVQICSLGNCTLLLTFRLLQDIFGMIGIDCPPFIIIIFALTDFLYLAMTNMYYVEILKAFNSILKYRILNGNNSRYCQLFLFILHIVVNFPMILEGTLFGPNIANQNEFLYKWSMLGAIAIMETAILGLLIAVALFRGISRVFEKSVSKHLATNIKRYLIVFVIIIILQDISYQSSGFLKMYNLESLSLSVLGIGTSISGFQLAYFTFLFKKTLEFLDTISISKKESQEAASLPESIAVKTSDQYTN
ncbi:hypothetical protein HDV06_000784 [Boothiomyces sp. JEL0866]|nr:hypothetical protein HDV06_000784 [Boothiomyces sp. JEL0866]